jgi:ubiquinone/menaquinone biosynthesis C-methylase UbiE
MEEEKLKEFAKQLRKPEGDFGLEVGEKMNKGNVYINQYTIEALSVSAGDNILELGMGNGFFVKDILNTDPSVQYTGYDFSQDMVKESIRRNQNFVTENRAQFILGDAQSMPFEKEVFNKAFTINTIYFWENREKVLSEFRRVLKPEGKLLIAVRPKRNMEQMPFTKYGFTMFSKEDLAALLADNGFNVTSVIEKTEPEQELGGKKLVAETLIIGAEKM